MRKLIGLLIFTCALALGAVTDDDILKALGQDTEILRDQPVSMKAVQKSFEFYSVAGMNRNNVKYDDFDVRTVVVRDPNHGAPAPQLQTVFKHKKTLKVEPHDTALILTYGAYPTVNSLIKLAQ